MPIIILFLAEIRWRWDFGPVSGLQIVQQLFGKVHVNKRASVLCSVAVLLSKPTWWTLAEPQASLIDVCSTTTKVNRAASNAVSSVRQSSASWPKCVSIFLASCSIAFFDVTSRPSHKSAGGHRHYSAEQCPASSSLRLLVVSTLRTRSHVRFYQRSVRVNAARQQAT